MLKTIGEYISEIETRYSKGVPSTDTRLKKRFIFSKLKQVRSNLIVQHVNKKQLLNDSFYQLLPAVELIPFSGTFINNVSLNNDLSISKEKLPVIITTINKPLIDFVSNIDGSFLYNSTTMLTLKNSKGRKYTSEKPNYVYFDNNLLLSKRRNLTAVSVRAVFENPIDAYLYPVNGNCENKCISYFEIPFYCDDDMGKAIIEITVEELLKVYAAKKEDKTGDTIDNT
jgi:hypothetical protein